MRIAATFETVHSHPPAASSATVSSAPELKPQATPLSRSEGAEFKSLVASMVPCRNQDPELWFAEQAPQMAAAKSLCKQCPLVMACLEGALEREEPWGVWGGEIIVDGQIVEQKRGRGRPRKSEAA